MNRHFAVGGMRAIFLTSSTVVIALAKNRASAAQTGAGHFGDEELRTRMM
jgi:hypothetical protein